MRRYLVLTLLAFLYLNQVVGQVDRFDVGKLHIGLHGGFNMTAIAPQHNYGQVLLDYKVPVRPMAGLAMMYQTGPRGQLVLEANYMVMGQNYEDFAKGIELRREVRKDYLVIPLMYRLILNKSHGAYGTAATFYNTNWYLTAGIQPGILLSSESRYEVKGAEADFISYITAGGNPNDDEITNLEPPENSEELFQPFDLSLVGGGGLFKRVGPRWQVYLEIRGGFSIMDVNAEDWRLPAGSGNYFGSYNMFIGLHGGVTYKLF